ncbi:uncharacterized protein DFL_001333 [Arthrobotrys flagrans]|uniref:Uncharacterized protein n=1 Tax=Arthrobotrys flagrans TaxID=97331 RepID=A0A437AGV2_ARTFL|nr:hypothetical protein DFL_001333 [Arthrobotrys flagrans]
MARDDGNLPEAVPSTLPQTYYSDQLPQVVESTTPDKWRHPQFASYTPSPPFIPPTEDRKILGLRRTTFFLSLALAVLIVFGIALGAGLGIGLRRQNNSGNTNSSGAETSSTTSPPSISTTSTSTPASTSTACNPARTAAITNGDFEAGGETSGDIRPWYIPELVAPATYEILNVNGTNVFRAICNSDLEHGAYTKVKLAQELRTCPGTDYDFEFRHNFLPGNNRNAYIVVFIDGNEVANIRAGPNDWVTYRGNFTSKSGNYSTLLQVDFAPVDFDSQEFFVDDFEITPA